MIKTFKVVIMPFLDESLHSWLIRLSIANGTDPYSISISLWNNKHFCNKDISRYLFDTEIDKLSKTTKLSTEKIKNLTLYPYLKELISSKTFKPISSWILIIPKGQRSSRLTNEMQFCPKCLKEDIPYLKRQWRLSWNVTCPIHNINLLHSCENCKTIYNPCKVDYLNNKIHQCTTCGYDLRLSHTSKSQKSIINFQEKLNNAFFNNSIDTSLPLVIHTKSEFILTFRIFVSLFKILSKRIKYNELFSDFGLSNIHISIKNCSNGTFEKMPHKDRLNFMILLERVFSFKLEDIKNIFFKHKVYKQMVNLPPYYNSKTFEYITTDSCRKKSSTTTDIPKEIKSKSKEVVDELFKTIEGLLK